jgi:predicted metal-dependent phosphotriesterase family hydrolase
VASNRRPSKRRPVTDVHRAIQECGAANMVISSDVYFDWLPPHVEVLRMFTGQLRFLGVTDEALRTMLVGNPARMLGLPE